MEMNTSNFRLVGIGEVAANKARSETTITFWPKELYPQVSDEIQDTNATAEVGGVDFDGNKYTSQVQQSFVMTADWLGDDHTVTPPDVRRGEQIFLYQVADSVNYYWRAMCRPEDLYLRRLETVVRFYSDYPNNDDVDFTRDNCYVSSISTHDKVVSFTTSNANGESNTYEFILDTGNGTFTVVDDQENKIYIDSPAHQLVLSNKENSYVELLKDVININADKSINLTTKAFTLNASSTIDMTTKTDTLTATNHYINGLTDHDSMVAAPSVSFGTSASTASGISDGYTSQFAGDFLQTSGKIDSPEINITDSTITNITATTITTDSITWSSASGPGLS